LDTVGHTHTDKAAAKASKEFICTVTANFTSEPIGESLQFWLEFLGFSSARIEFSGYNQVFQDLLAPTGRLRSSTWGVNVLLVRLEDWARSQEPARRVEIVKTATREFIEALSEFALVAHRPTIVMLCPISSAATADKEFGPMLHDLQQECAAAISRMRGVTLLTSMDVEVLYPVDIVEDPESDRQGHIPFATSYWTAMGTMVARKARPLFQPPVKVVVVDADNTLWNGVVGEIGPAQISLDEGRRCLQQRLLQLKRQGVLLAIASKNEERDVAAAFCRPDMLLHRDDFVTWKVNWESKSRNIAALARELELGLDSFVFLDDNPVECAEVGANCPGVIPILMPHDTAQLPEFLAHVWAFDFATKTALDENRTELYRQQSQRNQFRDAAGSFADFIAGLQLHVTVAPPSPAQYERAAQLTQRTNQFNTSGVRRTTAAFGSLIQSGEKQALLVGARDRFGDYGDVGLAIYSIGERRLTIETLLMSCRVLGKGVEHQLIAEIGNNAKRLGTDEVVIPFTPSERNLPAKNFLDGIGAQRIDDGSYRLSATQAAEVRFTPETAGSEVVVVEAGATKSKPVARQDFARIAASLRSVNEISKAIAGRLERERPQLSTNFIPPGTPHEVVLTRVWEEVLHVRKIGIHDRFLDLGGKSLHAVAIVGRIAAEIGVRLPLDVLFSNVTIADLAVSLVNLRSVETTLPKAGEIRLSASQQRLWFLNELIATQSAYNIPVARRIRGALRFDALEKGFQQLLQRHELLRSTYRADRGTATLNISPGMQVDLRRIRVASEEEALTIAAEDARRPFDLNEGPLFRCAVMSWSEEEHLLVINSHHIVSDGWSSNILLRDLGEAYAAAVHHRAPMWRALPSSYVDYSAWQEARRRTSEFKSDLDYWCQELRNASSLLELPTDKPRPAIMAYRGESVAGNISRTTCQRLDALAERAGCTAFTILLTVWQSLLYRYSHQEDIVVGIPVAGRTHPAVENIVGCFVNTLAIRSTVDGHASFLSQLDRTRRRLVEGLAHQELPFEILVNELGLERNLSRSPLFQTMLVFQDFQVGDFRPIGLDVSAIPLHNGGAKFDLLMEVTPMIDGYRLALEYNADLFMPETASRIMRHFIRLLETCLMSPDGKVDDLSMMSQAERDELLITFNAYADTALPYNASLQGLIEVQVARNPHAIALKFEEQALTYGELNSRANRLAHFLRRRGVGRGVFVGVFFQRSLDMVVGLLGVLKAGGAYVPIDPEYPAERVAFMMRDAGVSVVLSQKRLMGELPSYDGMVVNLDDDWAQLVKESEENPSHISDPTDPAYMIYTSGSTGLPKGAINAHRGICNRLLWMQKQYRMTAADTVLQKTPFSFDVSVWEFFWPLLVGARLVLAKPGGHRDPAYLVDLIATERVTIMHFVPSMLGAFLTAPRLDRCQSLRHVMCSGEALPFTLQEEFFARFQAELHNLYGPTEAAVDVTHWTCRPHDGRQMVPIGRPVSNTQIYILDRKLQPVPIGVTGDLYIGGIQVGLGYHNRPELTAERFIPDHLGKDPEGRLYKTGDLARFLSGGEIEYLGRSDHQVKIRGFRIELGEIEAALCQHPSIREAVVMAREDVPGMKRLVAYLVTSLSDRDLDAIRDHLKTHLPEFMVPAVFVFIEGFPLSPNGKIDRKALPTPVHHSESLGQFVAPRTVTEQKLVDIWSRVLRVERVGVRDNFFELGGDSILSIQAISLARREGFEITPALLFANQTIEELAAVVTTAEKLPVKEDLAVGEVVLTPIQRWFFEQDLEDPHHFNQAFMLEVVEPLDRTLVESALNELSRQHDALRLRFNREGRAWRQYYSDNSGSPALQWVDLSDVEAGVQLQQIHERAALMQAGLRLDSGPIWQVGYFKLGEKGCDRMVFVVHHLAVDGVSWRILVEDFESIYGQLRGGKPVQLPAKTASYKTWARNLLDVAKADWLKEEVPYWKAVTDGERTVGFVEEPSGSLENNLEGTATTCVVALSAGETDALLKQVPPVYNTHINDVLLTALVRAWGRWNRSRTLLLDLEGHGREESLGNVDSTRTVGWFTSIFPVRLSCSDSNEEWQPGETLKAVKEQLRRIPRRGVGYGILRYVSEDSSLQAGTAASVIFNYFGQFDHMLAGSRLFRLKHDSTGPWRSPKQRRRHSIEINCLVLDGRFEARWTCPQRVAGQVQQLADEYMGALRHVISHCISPGVGGRTPSDFPLARLDQSSLDQLLSEQHDVEDLYPLSPIQTLFYSANQTSLGTAFDQWHCTLDGPLQVPLFQQAWQETIQRHSVLRSTIHADGVHEPLQVVHHDVQLPWTIEDWRGISPGQIDARWRAFLQHDLSIPIKLTQMPAMRFALVQVGGQRWKFVWSVPALLLDGWSWPLVFRDASRLYESLVQGEMVQLETVRPYRDYIEWLKRDPQDVALAFWKKTLAGFREPTGILGEKSPNGESNGARYVEHSVSLPAGLMAKLQSVARRLHVTLNTLVQGGWALQLSRQSGDRNVVFGASFSARPTDLLGAESIVGPFVNNLPVRVAVEPHTKTGDFLRQLHGSLLELNGYQFTPLMDIQRVSEVPWRHRLFNSLVVFQNYLVDESARRFGKHVSLSDFSGPVHTNYPMLLLVEPGTDLRMTIVCDSHVISGAMRERWASDLANLFERMPDAIEGELAQLQAVLSQPPPQVVPGGQSRIQRDAQHLVLPQTKMEQAIAEVWGQLFGMDQVSVDDNFFDIGGHSMLLVRMHARLREVLKVDFPIVTLLQHPSIRLLARCFEQPAPNSVAEGDRIRERAKKQKEAMERSRATARKRS